MKDYDVKLTLTEAVSKMLGKVPHQTMGRNLCIVGPPGRHLRVSLQNDGEHNHYSLLRFELMVDDAQRAHFLINLEEPIYDPGSQAKSNPNLPKGGYFWGHDSRFYNYMPTGLDPTIAKIISHCEVRP